MPERKEFAGKGKYFEELNVGDKFEHNKPTFITEEKHRLYRENVENYAQIHINPAATTHGKTPVIGGLTVETIISQSIPEISDGTIIANWEYTATLSLAVFPGDSLTSKTEVVDKWEHPVKADRGYVKLRHKGFNQNGELVAEIIRTTVFKRKDRAKVAEDPIRQMFKPRRIVSYTPASDLKMIAHARNFEVDVVCLDLEDGVSFNRKEIARHQAAEALLRGSFKAKEVVVRVNSFASGLREKDLEYILPNKPDAVIISKVSNADEVREVGRKIKEAEKELGVPYGTIKIFVLVESAQGVMNLQEILGADPRIEAVILGGIDYLTDVEALDSEEKEALTYAKWKVLNDTKAFGLDAIYSVYEDIKNTEDLLKEAEGARIIGFTGMQAIHPDQFVAEKIFTPTPLEIERAKEIISVFEDQQILGKGAFEVKGKLIELPHAKRAMRLLARAQRIFE